MGNSPRRANRLHLEAVLEPFQAVPEPLASPEHYGDEHDVHVVDQVGGQKMADGRGATADADVQTPGGLLSRRKASAGWRR